MKFSIAAAGLALGMSAVSPAAPAPRPAAPGSAVEDAHCVVAFYMIAMLHEAKQGSISDEGAKMAKDGFLFYSGKLGGHTDDASLRAAIGAALKDKQADLKATATACLGRMGDRLEKTEEVVKSTMK